MMCVLQFIASNYFCLIIAPDQNLTDTRHLQVVEIIAHVNTPTHSLNNKR